MWHLVFLCHLAKTVFCWGTFTNVSGPFSHLQSADSSICAQTFLETEIISNHIRLNSYKLIITAISQMICHWLHIIKHRKCIYFFFNVLALTWSNNQSIWVFRRRLIWMVLNIKFQFYVINREKDNFLYAKYSK